MARDFDGSTQYGTCSSGVPKNGFPLTLAARFWPGTAPPASFRGFITLSDGGGGEYLHLGTDGTVIRMLTASAAVEDQVYASNTFTLSTWNSAVGIWTSSTNRRCILNGDFVNAGTGVAPKSTATLSTTYLANFAGGNLFDGAVAEVAAWGIDLTNADVEQYHEGVSPMLIQRRHLLGYWPVTGRFSTENDLVQGLNFTLTGSPPWFEHPAVYYPRRKAVYFSSPGAVTHLVSLAVQAQHDVKVVRSSTMGIYPKSPHAVALTRSTTLDRLVRAVHPVTVVAFAPAVRALMFTVQAVRQATLSIESTLNVRKLSGATGFGLFTRRQRRWSRRR